MASDKMLPEYFERWSHIVIPLLPHAENKWQYKTHIFEHYNSILLRKQKYQTLYDA